MLSISFMLFLVPLRGCILTMTELAMFTQTYGPGQSKVGIRVKNAPASTHKVNLGTVEVKKCPRKTKNPGFLIRGFYSKLLIFNN